MRQRERGKLKLYIGSAAGVGKTYRMLNEAHSLRARGVDVVIGFVETHGRAETAAQLADLDVIPRRRIEYRGVSLEEMDAEGIAQRNPEVAVVDELAHTNVPGSVRSKRWEDVIHRRAGANTDDARANDGGNDPPHHGVRRLRGRGEAGHADGARGQKGKNRFLHCITSCHVEPARFVFINAPLTKPRRHGWFPCGHGNAAAIAG